MPRRSKRKSSSAAPVESFIEDEAEDEAEDEDEVEDSEDEPEEVSPPKRRNTTSNRRHKPDDESIVAGGRSRSRSRRGRAVIDDEDEEGDGGGGNNRNDAEEAEEDDEEEQEQQHMSQFTFSQQAPERTQDVLPERPAERRNLDQMEEAARDKAITSLTRMVLFRALAKEPIDRLKILKDVGVADGKVSSAVFREASFRLRSVFGFELRRMPKYMERIKGLPAKYKDRYFVVNVNNDNNAGTHSRAIHSKHSASSIEKGLLMLVLALTFCKGEARNDGSRWILNRDLYRLLHKVDDAIPAEPPAPGTSRAKAATNMTSRFKDNRSVTPNVDYLLERFIYMDYLIREKATEENFSSQTEDGDVLYSMGPRAAMEIGRRQIIFFCAEILDEEADETMLKEIEEDVEDEEGEEAGFTQEI